MSNELDALEALAVNVTTPARMPIIWPGEIDPIVDADGKEAYLEFLPWDCDANRALDRKNHVNGVRKGFRQRSQAELREEAEKEDPVEDQVERLVVLISGWYLVGPNKEPIKVPFSKENARTLFANPKFAWLRRRGFSFVVNEKNFMRNSSKA